MVSQTEFNLSLIKKYDKPGPRYTSYPTAIAFNDDFNSHSYQQAITHNMQQLNKPVSLYFHVPFCDTLCFFCACNKIATKKRDKADKYINYLKIEMALLSELHGKNRVVKQLHFGGGTPTFLTDKQFQKLMTVISQYFSLMDSGDREYSIEIDPRSVDSDRITMLANLGFNRFSLGIQDIDPKVQKAVNRIQPIEMNKNIIDSCRKAGAKSISVDLIYGLPFQTLASFEKTIESVIELSPDRLSVFNYAHMPNLFSPQKRINACDLPKPKEKLKILQMCIENLTEAGYIYIGMDHFAKPDDGLSIAQKNGTLQRNFQGYSCHSELDLIAIGVSAISSMNNMFCQNVKSLEQYYAILDNNQLPINRGYLLNEDDLLRRNIIHEIACNFSLDIVGIEKDLGIIFKDLFAAELVELKAMQEDGLLDLTDEFMQVSAAGRLLVRHICKVFDVYIQNQSSNRFSKII